MKKITTLTFTLLFTAGVAFGQNSATVSQSGNNNDATIEQTYQSGASSSAINEAVVSQTGDNNDIMRLRTSGAGNLYDVLQEGNNNAVRQHPHQGDRGHSFNSLIDIDQVGNGNVVHDADQTGNDNEIVIAQNGSNNFADVEAQLSGATATAGNGISITQNGDGNKVGTGTATGAWQRGESNSMTINQADGAIAGTQTVQHIGTPSQEGGQGLVQDGIGNILMIDQAGLGNEVRFVLQAGNDNEAMITQGIGMHGAEVTQIGNGNSSTITQN